MNDIPIGTVNKNPLLDTRLYEVEYADGHRASLVANTVSINIFAQVNAEVNRHVLFAGIIDYNTDIIEVKTKDSFITSHNGVFHRKETSIGWKLLVQLKDGSTTWKKIKYMKEFYPIQVSEYTIQSKISNEPAYAWWISHVLKKREKL